MKKVILIVFLTTAIVMSLLFGIPNFFGYRLMFIQQYDLEVERTEWFCSIIFDAISALGALGAIWVAATIPSRIAKQQNKIALLEKRQRVFDDITMYIEKELSSWEFDLSKTDLFYKYSDTYINAIFDEKVKTFMRTLREKSREINNLLGDYDYAKKNGECKERDCYAIEIEIHNILDVLDVEYQIIKDAIAAKYFNL